MDQIVNPAHTQCNNLHHRCKSLKNKCKSRDTPWDMAWWPCSSSKTYGWEHLSSTPRLRENVVISSFIVGLLWCSGGLTNTKRLQSLREKTGYTGQADHSTCIISDGERASITQTKSIELCKAASTFAAILQNEYLFVHIMKVCCPTVKLDVTSALSWWSRRLKHPRHGPEREINWLLPTCPWVPYVR